MAKVIVGCKLPNGLIMELVKPGQLHAPAPVGERVTLKGANSAVIARSNPAEPNYGMTYVEDAFAAEWFKVNKDMAFVKSGAVFMVADEKRYQGEVKDRTGDVRTGMEPIVPELDDGSDEPGKIMADKEHYKRLTGTTQVQQ